VSLVGRPAENHPQQVGKRGALDKVDDRRTPLDLWNRLNDEFAFTLDAAASDDNALCANYYTVEDNGLERSWGNQRVWCNPPYSDCKAWVEKAWRAWAIEWAFSIVMLLPANRTEQAWWQDFIEPYRGKTIETRFLRGRLRFDTPSHSYDDPRGNRPPFGNVLVIWRPLPTSITSPRTCSYPGWRR